MMVETRKIMGLPALKITATTVRIPTMGGHSESINASFEKAVSVNEIKDILSHAPGVTLQDNPEKFEYPMPLSSHNKDDVFVGRIRMDESETNAINLWVVSDNLRKGAATNAIQIAEMLVQKGWFTA
jgi:aspartate-semialdehyde dehydrogenase